MNKRLESVLEFCNKNNYTIHEYVDTGGVRVTHPIMGILFYTNSRVNG